MTLLKGQNFVSEIKAGQPVKASHLTSIINALSGDVSSLDITITGNLTAGNFNPSSYATETYVLTQTESVYTNVNTSVSSSLHDVYVAIDNVEGGGGGDITLNGYSIYGVSGSSSTSGYSITAGANGVLRRISSGNLFFGLISGSNIAASTITDSNIASLSGSKIVTGTVTSNKLAANSVTNDKIFTGYSLVDNRIQNLGNTPSTWDLSNGTKAYANVVTTTNLTLSNPIEGMTGMIVFTQYATPYNYNVNIQNANKVFSFGRNTLAIGSGAKTMVSFIYLNSTYYFTFTPYS